MIYPGCYSPGGQKLTAIKNNKNLYTLLDKLGLLNLRFT